MDLTPIRIPNKRTYDYSKAGIAARRALNPTKRRKGRPLKPPTAKEVERHEDGPIIVAKEPKKRTLKNIKSRRKMSALEKLPTELLQEVFLYCLNLDLPRSSPIIGGNLGGASMYSRIILAAFGPTWSSVHSMEKLGSHEAMSMEDTAVLQTSILRCRWATLDVLLDAKDAWLKGLTRPREILPRYFLKHSEIDEDGYEILLDDSKSARAYLDADFAGFCKFTQDTDGEPVWETCSWERSADVADGLELPITLLSGPWTEDMTKYLFWLVKSGAKIDWINSTAGEVGITGLRSAIMDGDIRAIHLLQWAGLSEKLDMETLIWALKYSGGNRVAVINQLLRIGFVVLSDPDARTLGRALSELRDNAIEERDREKLEFFEAIRDSQTLKYLSDLHV